jgi:ATP-dependent helicase/nuclease subunit B
MQSFLEIVAGNLNQQFGAKLYKLAVVFPNRRQGVYFLHHLKQLVVPPAVLPEMLTIEEMVQRSSALPVADPMVQVFALYDAFVKVSLAEGDKPESIAAFDIFYPLGETLLKDFGELDNYLADVAQVYKVLYDIETIDKLFDYLTDEQRTFLKSFWAGASNKSSVQEKFLKLWQRLPAIYDAFIEMLGDKGLTTMGIAYRQLAGNAHTRQAFDKGWDHVAFVGMNALNKAEETFIKQWADEGRASFWLDADQWYADPVKPGTVAQEAGLFIRRNLHHIGLKNAMPLLNEIEGKEMTIASVAAPGQLAQAKLVGDWLKTLPAQNDGLRTGILLADETLLLPVLQSLPDSVKGFNVTMGYPMKQSPVFSFIQLFFTLHHHLALTRYKYLFHEFATAWLNHPFCDWPMETIEKLRQKMKDEVQLQVPVKQLHKITDMGNWLFMPLTGISDAFARLCRLLEAAFTLPAVQQDNLLKGLVSSAWQSVQQLEPLYTQLKPKPDLDFIGQMLQRQIGGLSVPFEGEPLLGIQVMGLLESRGLDFDHILLLGGGEGSLPRIKPPDSYLPENVRRAFGLPVSDHQDAIFAYVFYRLLHRSKSVTVVYNAQVSDNSTGEVSRFIQQVGHETNMQVLTSYPGFEVKPRATPPIEMPKTADTLGKLYHYINPAGTSSLSPSAINSWLHCRLQFYFKYVAKLSVPDKLEEGIDAATFGSIVHKLMELLYIAVQQKQGNNRITADSIAYMQAILPNYIDTAFKQGWRDDKTDKPFMYTGEMLVIKAVVQQYAEAFLKVDAAYTPFVLQDLEVKFSQPFAIEVNGRPERVLLGGYIDRVDEKEGVYRMVDYKTGSDKLVFNTTEELFEREGKKQNKAALQTLMYSLMFGSKYPERKRFEPALIPIRQLKGEAGDIQLEEKKGRGVLSADILPEVLEEYKTWLKPLIEEIFDGETAFSQTEDAKNCGYCDFREICGR